MITKSCSGYMSQDLHTPSWVCQRATRGDVVAKPGPNTAAAEHAAIAGGLKRWSTGRPLRRKLFHLSICMLGSAASDRASNPAENHHDGAGRHDTRYGPARGALDASVSVQRAVMRSNCYVRRRNEENGCVCLCASVPTDVQVMC